jgi:glycosyltransferase involved in cell wall biosynthesis
MPIRVLYDISVLGVGSFNSTGRTGIYRVVEHVAQGLARSAEIELNFCATQGLTQRAPGTIRACRDYLARHPGFHHIPFFEKEFPPVDIFHSPFHPIPREITAPARILTVHDLIPILFPEYMPAANTRMQRLSLYLLKSSDHLICNSVATNRDLCRLTGVVPERTHVTHLAADASMFHPCEDTAQMVAVRQKYGLWPTPYLLSLCTLEPRKNIDHVIRAFVRLLHEGKAGDSRLVLAGTKGWDVEKILKGIDADPILASRIVTTGYVPDEELSPLYTGALVFVYMSRYEGFGLPPLEAMQCGTPVITSNTSSLPEVVGDAGITMDPADLDGLCSALHQVMENPALRQEMSRRARRQASCFNWDKCIEQTIAVYKKVLSVSEFRTRHGKGPAVVVDGVIFQLQHGKPFGISRQWLSLLSELSHTSLAGRIVLLDRNGTAPDIPGLRRRKLPAFRLGNACDEAAALDEICRAEGAGLFVSTYYTFCCKTDSLLMLYDMIPERFDKVSPDAPNPEWRDKYHAIENSTSFIAISQSTVRDFTQIYPQAAQRPLTVVPCAASNEFRLHSPDENEAFRAASGLNRPYFLLVGRQDAHKNLRLFFKAFGRLPGKERYAIVMAGGRRELEPEILRLVGAADLYAGFFSDRDLSLAYSGALALVFPSICEGFGLPILEAMQSGCPVIACPNSSIPEVAGSAALYVGENDVDGMASALMEVQQPDVRRHLTETGLQQSWRFSWKKSAGSLAEAIRRRLDARVQACEPGLESRDKRTMPVDASASAMQW